MRQTTGYRVFTVFNYTFFVLLGATMVYPLWYMLMLSLSSEYAVSTLYLWPQGFTLDVYRQIIEAGNVFVGYRNSFIIVTLGTFISLTVTVFAGYALSRRWLYGRRVISTLIVFTMLFNGGIIPTFLVVRSYGMVDTLWALMLPTAVNVYNLLIMTRFLANIPDSLVESAYIDGYNDIAILFAIIIPLSKAALAVVGLFYAVFTWNAFFPGLIYINDNNKYPLQTILYLLVKSSVSMEQDSSVLSALPESIKMATAFMTMVPIMLVYPFIQKHFVKGVMIGSIKG
jgi:putative aldouronate transport system permease protein